MSKQALDERALTEAAKEPLRATTSMDPAALGALFLADVCVSCSLDGDTAFWKFRSGLTLTLEQPDESKQRYKHHWHIGTWKR